MSGDPGKRPEEESRKSAVNPARRRDPPAPPPPPRPRETPEVEPAQSEPENPLDPGGIGG